MGAGEEMMVITDGEIILRGWLDRDMLLLVVVVVTFLTARPFPFEPFDREMLIISWL